MSDQDEGPVGATAPRAGSSTMTAVERARSIASRVTAPSAYQDDRTPTPTPDPITSMKEWGEFIDPNRDAEFRQSAYSDPVGFAQRMVKTHQALPAELQQTQLPVLRDRLSAINDGWGRAKSLMDFAKNSPGGTSLGSASFFGQPAGEWAQRIFGQTSKLQRQVVDEHGQVQTLAEDERPNNHWMDEAAKQYGRLYTAQLDKSVDPTSRAALAQWATGRQLVGAVMSLGEMEALGGVSRVAGKAVKAAGAGRIAGAVGTALEAAGGKVELGGPLAPTIGSATSFGAYTAAKGAEHASGDYDEYVRQTQSAWYLGKNPGETIDQAEANHYGADSRIIHILKGAGKELPQGMLTGALFHLGTAAAGAVRSSLLPKAPTALEKNLAGAFGQTLKDRRQQLIDFGENAGWGPFRVKRWTRAIDTAVGGMSADAVTHTIGKVISGEDDQSPEILKENPLATLLFYGAMGFVGRVDPKITDPMDALRMRLPRAKRGLVDDAVKAGWAPHEIAQAFDTLSNPAADQAEVDRVVAVIKKIGKKEAIKEAPEAAPGTSAPEPPIAGLLPNGTPLPGPEGYGEATNGPQAPRPPYTPERPGTSAPDMQPPDVGDPAGGGEPPQIGYQRRAQIGFGESMPGPGAYGPATNGPKPPRPPYTPERPGTSAPVIDTTAREIKPGDESAAGGESPADTAPVEELAQHAAGVAGITERALAAGWRPDEIDSALRVLNDPEAKGEDVKRAFAALGRIRSGSPPARARFVPEAEPTPETPEETARLKSDRERSMGEAPPKRTSAERASMSPSALSAEDAATRTKLLGSGARYATSEVVPRNRIHVDPKQWQQRAGAREIEGGDAGRVGLYDSFAADKTLLWRDPDGKLWLVNGHNRLASLDRAIKAGSHGADHPVDAHVLESRLGVTQEQAYLHGALSNMRGDNFVPLDGARVIRDLAPSGVDPTDWLMREGVQVKRYGVREALALAKLSPEAFRAVSRGAITPEIGAKIGRSFHESEHGPIIEHLAKMAEAGTEATPELLQQMRSQIDRNSQIQEGASRMLPEDLFRHANDRAEVVGAVKQALRAQKRTRSTLVSGHEDLSSEGQTLNRGLNEARLGEAVAALDAVNKHGGLQTALADMIDSATKLWVNRPTAREEIVQAVLDRLNNYDFANGQFIDGEHALQIADPDQGSLFGGDPPPVTPLVTSGTSGESPKQTFVSLRNMVKVALGANDSVRAQELVDRAPADLQPRLRAFLEGFRNANAGSGGKKNG